MSGGTIDKCYAFSKDEITIKNGSRGDGGGGILNTGTMNMTGGTIQNCYVEGLEYGCGGGILNTEDGVLKIYEGLIQYNYIRDGRPYSAGVGNWGSWYSGSNLQTIHQTNARTYIYGGTYQYNENTNYAGGGLGTNFSYMEVTGGLVTHNTAGVLGGGIVSGNGGELVIGGDVEISYNNVTKSNTFSDTDSGGGGVCIGKASGTNSFRMTGGSIIHNTCDGKGGGLYLRDVFSSGQSNDISIEGGLIAYNESGTAHNESYASGGGLYTNGNVVITGGEISNNTSYTQGGGIYLGEHSKSIEMSGGVVKDNTARYEGGGIYITGGDVLEKVEFTGGEFNNNTSNKNGGGFYLGKGNVTINSDDKEFKVINNHALNTNSGGYGGGFYLNNGDLTIESTSNDIKINGNTSDLDGAGFYSAEGAVSIINAEIKSNIASNNGGAFYSKSGATISASTIQQNQAYNFGGAFYIESGETTVDGNSVISGNSAKVGGAAYVLGKLNLDASTITGNTAATNGGGIFANGGLCRLTNGMIVDNNNANYGGGFYVGNGGSVKMEGGSISGNTALYDGGAIYTLGNFTLNSGTIASNTATSNNGGAVYAASGAININDGDITDNEAKNDGGAIFTKGELNMDGGSISGNKSLRGGGLFVEKPDDNSCPGVTITEGSILNNLAIDGGGVYVNKDATLSLYKSAVITGNNCGDAESGMGGGIYQRGTLNVAGTEVQVAGNYKVNPVNANAASILNNVYLVSEHEGFDDYSTCITIVNWTDESTTPPTIYKGVQGTVNIGITIDEVPQAVIHSDSPTEDGHLEDLYEALSVQSPDALLKDDLRKFQAVYTDGPDPYDLFNIFFTATWQQFAYPEGVTEFKDSDRASDHDTYFGNINSEQRLAEFMCYVNGLNGYSAHPGQLGKVTSDLYMNRYLWLPIGGEDNEERYSAYQGHFDGGGHIINGLKSIPLIGLHNYGLFGRTKNATISNTFVTETDFRSNGSDTLGIIIGTMLGGKMYYSEGGGQLSSSGSAAIMGGLVGYAQNAEIHSCMAMPSMQCNGDEAKMGGLVGKMNADGTSSKMGLCQVFNCFANPMFTTTSTTAFGGGLAGVMDKRQNIYSICEISECYVRLDRLHHFPETNNIGALVGDMVQTGHPTNMRNVFFPVADHCGIPGQGSMITKYRATNKGNISNFATYAAVSDPGSYHYDPSQDTYIAVIQEGVIPAPDEPTLLPQLQTQARNKNWVPSEEDRPVPPVCYWKRTGASAFLASGENINGDYPILDFDSVSPICGKDFAPAYISLGSKDGLTMDYCSSLSDMLRRYNDYEGGGTINLFHSVDNSTGTYRATDQDVRIYFDEGVTILQGPDSYLNAVSYQTLRTGSADYWHTFSTVMGPRVVQGVTKGQSLIGIKYGKPGQQPHNLDPDPCKVSLDFGPDQEHKNSNNTLFPYDTPVEDFDLYAFYEPQYHWINFKRNSSSHWHMDSPDPINYTNEEYLMPGKGYLVALQPEKKIYEYGVLNCGNISTSSRTEDPITSNVIDNPYHGGYGYQGYNLLGNPYQAYLNFNEFARQNSALWSGSSSLDYCAFVYDAEYDLYLGINADVTASAGSIFPGQWLAPHQGFFIVKSNLEDNAPTTAKFVEVTSGDMTGMCSLEGDGGLLRSEKPANRLVNLILRDGDGHGDALSVEFGNGSLKGLAKQKTLRSGNAIIYTRYNGEDYALLQLEGDAESLPVNFDCTEGGTYTLTWNTANGQFVRLALVDNLTGVSTDCLSHDSYTFEANPSDFKSRFKLVFQYSFDDDGNDTESANGTANFAFVNNGDLIVNGQGYMQIMDVNGHVVASERLTDSQSRVSMPQVAAGIYIVRLGEKVQKIVIR